MQLFRVQMKEAEVMKDIIYAVSIFHTLALVGLFGVMVATVVHLVSQRIQPKG